jgi:hypothetical protein
MRHSKIESEDIGKKESDEYNRPIESKYHPPWQRVLPEKISGFKAQVIENV